MKSQLVAEFLDLNKTLGALEDFLTWGRINKKEKRNYELFKMLLGEDWSEIECMDDLIMRCDDYDEQDKIKEVERVKHQNNKILLARVNAVAENPDEFILKYEFLMSERILAENFVRKIPDDDNLDWQQREMKMREVADGDNYEFEERVLDTMDVAIEKSGQEFLFPPPTSKPDPSH